MDDMERDLLLAKMLSSCDAEIARLRGRLERVEKAAMELIALGRAVLASPPAAEVRRG